MAKAWREGKEEKFFPGAGERLRVYFFLIPKL